MTSPGEQGPKPEANKSLILIADGNQARGKRLADGCKGIGFKCAVAPHGAAALELALGSPPDLVISEVGLPLVDGYKLADILRANPRTRSARFIFLGSADEEPGSLEVADLSIPITSPVPEILRVVQEVMVKRQRIEAIDDATRRGSRVDGELSDLPLGELLQVIHLGRKSGRIDLEREGDDTSLREASPSVERGMVLVRDGDILQSESGSVEGEKALFRLLAWRQGRFTFEPGKRPTAPPKILAPVRALLSEGHRQIAEWDRLSLELPPLDAQVRLRIQSADLPNIVHPLTQEVLLLLEHYPVVRQIVDRCSFPDYQVLRTLHTLVERGIVQIGQVRVTGLAPAARGETLFDEVQVRRIREALQSTSTRGARRLAGKIILVASDPDVLPDMLKLLREVPGFDVMDDDSARRRPFGFSDVGQIRLDDDHSIDLVEIPADEDFRPLWPLAGHEALGVMLLLSGPVGEAAARLRPLCEVLEAQPRARVLHVVLLSRKERVTPDELRENLALFDESSLFLLPLESDKEPTALLRSLFSRIVP